ncbi:hypothetical protein ACFUC1_12805 [Pedococcus sp. NPDC057267]|uniref:hypothetical protein n=1 Tax=Pedococcus sp. NPDC057267 TaxID=3346077 RepID=UPI003634A9CE
MEQAPGATVTTIHVHPVKGQPGQELSTVEVGPDGLHGDRPKKAAVMVLSADDTTGARANLVVTMPPAQLSAAVGRVLRVGTVELEVTGPAGSCPGVYAAVRRPGTVSVGDAAVVGEASADEADEAHVSRGTGEPA